MTDFNSPQYKRVMAACKERDKFPTQAWIPDEEKCVHAKLHKAEVNEELSKAECFNAIVEGMKILGWIRKKRLILKRTLNIREYLENILML